MRLLQGTKVVEAPPSWRVDLLRDARPVVIDLGAGDGRFAYESARADPERLYIAIDPDADALGEYAYRASRKPARGGVANATFVVASVEQIPLEVQGLASMIRVNFPWGSLLHSLIQPDSPTPRALATLAPNGRFELVLSYDPAHDTGAFSGQPLPSLDESYISAILVPAYLAAGLHVSENRRLTQDEALAIPSTWGRRLLHARPRDVFWLAGDVSTDA